MTPALWEALKLVAAGRSDPQVAKELGISPSAAKERTKRLLAYFDVDSRTQLVVLVYREGIL